MRSFIQRHLDPATRVAEAMFGLIMAMGITGAVRVSSHQASHQELFIAVLGCNVAWGLVDAVMFVMLKLFERSRRAKIVRDVQSASNESQALHCIQAEFAELLEPLATLEERNQIYQWALATLRRTPQVTPTINRNDIMGGIAVGLLVMLVTMPLVLPFMVISHFDTAVRASNFIALALLFALGNLWAREVGAHPLRISCGVTGVGVVLVLLTIALGG